MSNGRWHTQASGKRIVYLTDHPAVALIEVLAHLKGQPKFFPTSFQLMKIKVADEVSADSLAPDALPANWREDPSQTRSIGDSWLARRSAALLIVPSIPSPESLNYLFNPLHPNAKGMETEWCNGLNTINGFFTFGRRVKFLSFSGFDGGRS